MKLNASVKEVQGELLIIMKEFDRICRANDIKYTLDSGTLLGAIREKGFIPWDDDADVAMRRKDYDLLAAIFNQNSDEFQLIDSFLHMPRIIRKTFTKDTPFSWLDIYIYDSISENRFAQKLKIYLIMFFQAMCRNSTTVKLACNKGHKRIQMILFYLSYVLGKPFSYKTKFSWYNNFCRNCLCGSKQKIHISNNTYKGMKNLLPISCMDNYMDAPFEDTFLMIMKDYHKRLVACYGNDYMIPVCDNDNHQTHLFFKEAFIEHLNLTE